MFKTNNLCAILILSYSMYALKDESYVRQTLQKQAAALHHASVTYSVSSAKYMTVLYIEIF